MLFSALKEVLLLGGGCTNINGWQGVTTWKEFKLTLLKSQFVSQKLKPYGKDMKKPCACKICGEIGHNPKEHKDECPNCEGSHPVEECPTRQITCFLCEGTTHYPAQCHIYPMVQRTIQQKKEVMKGALIEILEEVVMKEEMEDTPKKNQLNPAPSLAIHVEKKDTSPRIV